ncbi:hypothetical protein J6590_039169 [Homalodisca vitripennis]|nr:hypothetical protein J6590_039169 [Homalodisca vitripennis]
MTRQEVLSTAPTRTSEDEFPTMSSPAGRICELFSSEAFLFYPLITHLYLHRNTGCSKILQNDLGSREWYSQNMFHKSVRPAPVGSATNVAGERGDISARSPGVGRTAESAISEQLTDSLTYCYYIPVPFTFGTLI